MSQVLDITFMTKIGYPINASLLSFPVDFCQIQVFRMFLYKNMDLHVELKHHLFSHCFRRNELAECLGSKIKRSDNQADTGP